MNSEEFVRELRKEVIEDGMTFYQEFFENKDDFSSGDSYWRDVTTFYAGLDEKQQAVLLAIVRQVSVDTVSNLLGIIDGVCYLEGLTGQLSLKFGTWQ